MNVMKLTHRWSVKHISITHQTSNYISVQTPCDNLIQFTTKREKMASWVSRAADIWRGISWILSLSLCLCVYVCLYSIVMSKIRLANIFLSPYFPPSVLHHLSQRLMCVFILASLFPPIPHFHHSAHCPSLTYYYLDWDLSWVCGSFSMTNRPKRAKKGVFRHILSVICCRSHCFRQDSTFWIIFISQFFFLLAYLTSHVFPSSVQSGLFFGWLFFTRHFQ